jgi:hypothetical protein
MHWPNAPPDPVPAMRLTPRFGEVSRLITGARKTIVAIKNVKSIKNSLERRASVYRSSIIKIRYILFIGAGIAQSV